MFLPWLYEPQIPAHIGAAVDPELPGSHACVARPRKSLGTFPWVWSKCGEIWKGESGHLASLCSLPLLASIIILLDFLWSFEPYCSPVMCFTCHSHITTYIINQ